MSQPAERSKSELEADLLPKPTVWESAAHNKVPEDAWEFHIRKQLNDAAYNNLEYVPYCSTMPVKPKDNAPKFMWKRKER